jgi:hypothetical protein
MTHINYTHHSKTLYLIIKVDDFSTALAEKNRLQIIKKNPISSLISRRLLNHLAY